MTTATFDSHEHIKHLIAGGLTEQQAEAIVSADARRREAERRSDDGPVTKKDLKIVVSDLKVFGLKWYFAGQIALIGVLFTMLKTMLPATP